VFLLKKINLAIVGATGMVGRTFLDVLALKKIPINNLYLFASANSIGKKVMFCGDEYTVQELNQNSFDDEIHIALFSAGADVSKIFAPIASSKGCIVIDNSSAWRMHDCVPLVVPEVNPEDINFHSGIIANPNCSTIQAVVALKPLHDKYKIKRIVYSTYQSVSGAGIGGMHDLEDGENFKYFDYQIKNNLIPQIDTIDENGYTNEEMKLVNETRKILKDDKINITATCVRVPVFFGHCESINIEFENSFDLEQLIVLLRGSKGLIVQDDMQSQNYPMPINCAGQDEVFVGRIRRDYSVKNGVNLWVVADNMRKGAATNTVQIAELLLKTLQQ
jgi:aspartate-semialdehyde dehydrogenase